MAPPNAERWRDLVAWYFNPEHVNLVLELIMLESSGNPDAVNPSSGASGLLQHLPKYWNGQLDGGLENRLGMAEEYYGFQLNGDILDPETNIAVAAWLLYNTSSGWHHWTPTHGRPEYTDPGAHAPGGGSSGLPLPPEDDVARGGPLPGPYQGTVPAGGTSPDPDAGIGGQGGTTTTGDTEVTRTAPAGGDVYEVDGIGRVAVYRVTSSSGLTAWVFYTIEDDTETDLGALGDGGFLSQEQFEVLFGEAGIDGGHVSELWTIEQTTYQEWFEETLLDYSGYNRVALENDEVFDLLMEALINGWSEDEFDLRLENTTWWQQTAEQGRRWANLTDVERQVEIEGFAGQLVEAWLRLGGESLSISDPWLHGVATEVASGTMTYQAAIDQLRQKALEDPNSPESQRDQARFQRPVTIENTTMQLRDMARRWGVTVSDEALTRWATGIVDNDVEATMADFEGFLKDQAEITYGSREAGTSVRGRNTVTLDHASPWISTYADLMETSAAGEAGIDLLFNESVQRALQRQLSVADFRTFIRSQDEWYATDRARDEAISIIGDIGRRMGFQ